MSSLQGLTPTGIMGFDEMITGGGLPRGRAIMVAGGPGAGKSTFGLQFLVDGCLNHNEPGVYISLLQPIPQLIADARNFGWDLKRLEADGKLAFIDASPSLRVGEAKMGEFHIGRREFTLGALTAVINSGVQAVKAQRLVVDSLSSLILQYANLDERALAINDLIEAISETGCTSLIVSDLKADVLAREFALEEYLSSGVIILRAVVSQNIIVRGVQIQKLKGALHDLQIRPYKITDKGIEVFPKESVFLQPP